MFNRLNSVTSGNHTAENEKQMGMALKNAKQSHLQKTILFLYQITPIA